LAATDHTTRMEPDEIEGSKSGMRNDKNAVIDYDEDRVRLELIVFGDWTFTNIACCSHNNYGICFKWQPLLEFVCLRYLASDKSQKTWASILARRCSIQLAFHLRELEKVLKKVSFVLKEKVIESDIFSFSRK